jgi:hypothetical protein
MVKISVHTTHTLLEVFEKVEDGRIKVEGAKVILDVTTNYVRGTRGLSRVTPEEESVRVGKVITALKEKGQVGWLCAKQSP